MLEFYEAATRYAACADAVERATQARTVVDEFLRPPPPRGVRISADVTRVVEGGLSSSPPSSLFDAARQEAASTLEGGPLRRFAALRDGSGAADDGTDRSSTELSRKQRKGALSARAERARAASMRDTSASATHGGSPTGSGSASGLGGDGTQARKRVSVAVEFRGRARSLFQLSTRDGRLAPTGGSPKGEAARQGQHLRQAALKLGFLLKRGGRHPSWKRRWVALVVSGLGYFEDETQGVPKGFVPFHSVNAFVPDADEEVGRRFAFVLHVHDRAYVFQAANERDKGRWVEALLPFLGSLAQTLRQPTRRQCSPASASFATGA